MANIQVKSIVHLREVAKEYEICEFVEGPTLQGFDPEGISVAHLLFVGDSNLNKIFVPQEIEGNNGIPKIVISTNVKKLKHSK